MSLLKNMVNFRYHTDINKNFFNYLTEEDKKILSKIKDRPIKRFNSEEFDKLIPIQVIKVFIRQGYLPQETDTTRRMRVTQLIKLLSKGPYSDKQPIERLLWLRDVISNEEFPEYHRPNVFYLKPIGERGKEVPSFYYWDKPGTILK